MADREPLDISRALQLDYEATTPADARKSRGQVFTPPEVATFMAQLVGDIPSQLRLLDPGAGIGTLTAAICQRVRNLRSPRAMHACLFERDASLISYLERNMRHCVAYLRNAGHTFEYDIVQDDFLRHWPKLRGQRSLFDSAMALDPFDAVVMNPPYFKINGDSAHAKLLSTIVHGQPNIYALFLAAACGLLKSQGKLVAITPRSFCSGLYFREFRRWFFQRMTLSRVHLFESRTETFRESNVLQESVITVSERLGKHLPNVQVTRSFGRDVSGDLDAEILPSSIVVDDSSANMWVRIPESSADTEIVRQVDAWPQRFSDLGLRISTGPVVAFRAAKFLRKDADEPGTVPLYSVHNVRPFQTVWPLATNGKPTAFRLCSGSKKLVLPTLNYVFLRRFSAKEERRRLTASCFFAANQRALFVAVENHLNYVYHRSRELTGDEVYGLAALFNSALLDRYFRTISGNTQVNATEVRTMPFPDLTTVAAIGLQIRRRDDLNLDAVEEIVRRELRMEIGGIASVED